MTQKLLSFLRDGLAATTDQQPGAAAQLRPALSITTALTSNGMATRQVQSPPFHVLGPGDVISLNPERIIVRSPTPDSLLAAENEFAWIDFDRADFPWLFTPFGPVGPSDEPANPDKKTRLTPWLCLIVLAEQDGISLEPAIPNWQLTLSEPFNLTANLPDLKQSHTGHMPRCRRRRGKKKSNRTSVAIPNRRAHGLSARESCGRGHAISPVSSLCSRPVC